jgi:hypothetical protein
MHMDSDENAARDERVDRDERDRPDAEGNRLEKKSDESWKEKAQREKEKLASEAGDRGARMPPASFLGLLEELSLRTMLALGQLREPATGGVYFDLEAAKYAIDLLGVLEEKTKGNLDPGEKAALEDALHTLRLIFVQAARHPPAAAELDEGGPRVGGAPGEGGAPSAGGALGGGRGAGPGGAGPEGSGPSAPGPKIIF